VTVVHASRRARHNALNHATVPFTQVPLVLLTQSGVARLAGVAAIVAAGVAGCLRARTLRVEEGPDGLVVHNLFRTVRLRWEEIERVERRRSPAVSEWASVVCPVAVTATRRVTLLAMPVELRRRKRPAQRLTGSAVVERWEERVPG
jgi:hypothetical protein